VFKLRNIPFSLLILVFSLAASAQDRGFDLVGKWVIDSDRMMEVRAGWEPPPYDDRFISTRYRDGKLVLQGSPVWHPGHYDTSNVPATIGLAKVRARWEGDRLILDVEFDGTRLIRTIYREGRWLVFADREGSGADIELTYFIMS